MGRVTVHLGDIVAGHLLGTPPRDVFGALEWKADRDLLGYFPALKGRRDTLLGVMRTVTAIDGGTLVSFAWERPSDLIC